MVNTVNRFNFRSKAKFRVASFEVFGVVRIFVGLFCLHGTNEMEL